jgi:hypothetical protein
VRSRHRLAHLDALWISQRGPLTISGLRTCWTAAPARRRVARLLDDMLEHGTADLLYTGVGVNLLALRHEICTVLVIDDPGWYERECGELRICDEYLQQCEQVDLLADQRWVQLISLDRHGLEMEPRWQDPSALATSCSCSGSHRPGPSGRSGGPS